MTFDLGTNSVVALRDSQGEIRAFHNVCRHRGARMLDGAGHCPGAITCPYHGWSYRLSGELLGITERDSFPRLDRSQWGLKPVRSQVVFGFVFVCLAGEPPPLETVWGEFARRVRAASLRGHACPLGPLYTEHWDCDWKIAMDNYLESYHVPIGHPGLFRMFTPDYEDQVHLPTGVARGISWLRERALEPLERAHVPEPDRAEVSQELPEQHRRRWSFYSMLPNLGIDMFPDQMDFFQVLPRGPGQVHHPRRLLRASGLSGARCASFAIWRAHQPAGAARGRVSLPPRAAGLGSRSYEPGPLSRLENCMLEFHDLLRERIPEVRQAQSARAFRLERALRQRRNGRQQRRDRAPELRQRGVTGPLPRAASDAPARPV